MDYDVTDIPAGYDRSRSHGPELLDLWMSAVARYTAEQPIRTILDLGCGTGRFTNVLGTHFGACVIGVDPSRKMLEHARVKCAAGQVRYLRASGEAIPLSDNSVDLVFMSMVFHHFTSAVTVARECHRVGRDGAIIFLRAATVEHIPAYPYVPFIPAARLLLAERLNTAPQITATFEAAGFETIASDVIVQQIASTLHEYADKLAAGGDSILASLGARDLHEGLDALRRQAALVDPQAVTEPIDVFVFRR